MFGNKYENWILGFDWGLSVADFLQQRVRVNVNVKEVKSGNIICSLNIFFSNFEKARCMLGATPKTFRINPSRK